MLGFRATVGHKNKFSRCISETIEFMYFNSLILLIEMQHMDMTQHTVHFHSYDYIISLSSTK